MKFGEAKQFGEMFSGLAVGLLLCILFGLGGCGKTEFESAQMRALAEDLKAANALQYPLEDYFPEIPVTVATPPAGEDYHTCEDSFAPAGTPVYAAGDGVIRFSGRAKGYGGLIIIDHPQINAYTLYGHLSPSKWKKATGKVSKGELIGYLGEAAECYTMFPHIHFGIRSGQKADYPGWGNWRWMAGYPSCPPDSVGWFHPSEIIGGTEFMREWKAYRQQKPNPPIERDLLAADFRITSSRHHQKEDLDKVVMEEFGDEYRLADWNDIRSLQANLGEWADAVGITEGEAGSLLISNDGYRIWLGRQFYLSRFNHNKPKQYLAHDNIEKNLLCLGSWYEVDLYVLAVKR